MRRDDETAKEEEQRDMMEPEGEGLVRQVVKKMMHIGIAWTIWARRNFRTPLWR